MDRKPWPIIILATLHFLEPIAKIFFYTTLWHMPLSRYLGYLTHSSNRLDLILFATAFPLGGLCILSVKKWSLPSYFAIQVLTLGAHIYHHMQAPQAFPLALVAFMTLANLTVVTYFLLPAVRLAYLDPKIRWWEAKPRYLVNWKGRALQGKTKIDILISNISEGGVFVSATAAAPKLDVANPVQVEFDFFETPFSLVGTIRHHSAQGNPKYGIQFSELTPGMKSQMHKGMRALRKSKYPRQGHTEETWASFRHWVVRLFTTGQGLIPEPAKLPTKKTQISVTEEQQHNEKTGTF